MLFVFVRFSFHFIWCEVDGRQRRQRRRRRRLSTDEQSNTKLINSSFYCFLFHFYISAFIPGARTSHFIYCFIFCLLPHDFLFILNCLFDEEVCLCFKNQHREGKREEEIGWGSSFEAFKCCKQNKKTNFFFLF